MFRCAQSEVTSDHYRYVQECSGQADPTWDWILVSSTDFISSLPCRPAGEQAGLPLPSPSSLAPPQPLTRSSCPLFFCPLFFFLFFFFPFWLICSIGKVVFKPLVRKHCASLRYLYFRGVQQQRGNSQNLGGLLGGFFLFQPSPDEASCTFCASKKPQSWDRLLPFLRRLLLLPELLPPCLEIFIICMSFHVIQKICCGSCCPHHLVLQQVFSF